MARKSKKQTLENIEKMKQNIEESKKLPKEQLDKMNKRVFDNILIAIFVMLYFYLINLGSINIAPEKLELDLKVFSVVTILITVFIFEIAYKKDSGRIAIYGIESIFISLATLFLAYLFTIYNKSFHLVVFWISLAFAIYYVAKSMIIYLKMKKEYSKSLSDIGDIIKEK